METDEDVENRPELHSLLDVPECYIQVGNSNGMPTYWQNYLIVRGTLALAMRATPTGIMRNIGHLIRKHGLAMYSNKTYFWSRTQLPLLALMVEDYLETAEQDDVFLKAMLPKVVKEFEFWMTNRSRRVQIGGNEYLIFRYNQIVDRPRPENYKEDSERAAQLSTLLVPNYKEEIEKFYANLYSLDESGFEFTTRFRRARPDGKGFDLDIINIVPVELMSVLHRCATILSGWYRALVKTTPGKEEEYRKEDKKYKEIGEDILKTITEVLYNEKKGAWFDYSITDGKRIEVYYATNLLPLLTASYDVDNTHNSIGNNALKYLISEKIITENLKPNFFLIPTSKEKNGGRGDYPNGSVLLNVLIIEGLNLVDSDNDGTKVVAKELASVLVKTIYKGFHNSKVVLENYNAKIEDIAVSSTSEPNFLPPGVGAVNLLMKWFGSQLKVTEYDDFKPNPDSAESSGGAGTGASRKRPLDSTAEPKIGESSGNAEDEPHKKSRNV